MSIALPARFPERLVAECPDAVIYADAAGNIRYWNAAATRTFGFGAIEAIGSPLDLIIPEWLRSRHWEGYNKVMSGAQSRYDEGALLAVPALHKDGRQISIEFAVLPLRDDTGSLVGIAAFLRDVTKRFKEVRALRRELATHKNERQVAAPLFHSVPDTAIASLFHHKDETEYAEPYSKLHQLPRGRRPQGMNCRCPFN